MKHCGFRLRRSGRFKALTAQRYEWTSPTAYKDSSVSQFVCEGSLCGQFARCTTMALGDYQLQ